MVQGIRSCLRASGVDWTAWNDRLRIPLVQGFADVPFVVPRHSALDFERCNRFIRYPIEVGDFESRQIVAHAENKESDGAVRGRQIACNPLRNEKLLCEL